jgi:hypothetical protein
MSKDSCCTTAGSGRGTGGDGVDATDRSRAVFNRDPVAWLVGQGIRHLNAADAEGELGLMRVIELLRSSGTASAAIGQALHDSPQDDHSLRWSLLYLLAEVDEARSAEVFFRAAAEPVPSADHYKRGCETPRDGEVLVRTMAIAGLARRARQDKDAVHLLFKLLEAQPERALRVEAVKALLAVDAQHAERIRSMLPQELHFALDLKRVRAEVLAVEHEPVSRSDSTPRGPELGSKRRAPKSTRCDCC